MRKRINIINKFIDNNQLLESSFLDFKKYSFFIGRYNSLFSVYDYKIVFKALKQILFIFKSIHRSGGTILFIGLAESDFYKYFLFNAALKKLVISKGHLYADGNFKGFFYNRWSLYRRRSSPSNFFLSLQKHNKFPCALVSFSKKKNDAIFKECSKFGIPIFYILDSCNNFQYRDYPVLGIISSTMLNFYLNLLKYSFKYVR